MSTKKLNVLLLAVGMLALHSANAFGKYSSSDCNQFIYILRAVQLPTLSYVVDIDGFESPTTETYIEKRTLLNIPRISDDINILRAAKRPDTELESVVELAGYWGISPEDMHNNTSYWSGSYYVMKNYSKIENIACDDSRKENLIDVALFTSMVTEVFPPVGFDDVELMEDVHKRFYVVTYRKRVDEYEAKITLRKSDVVYTVWFSGNDRLELNKNTFEFLRANV